MSTETVRWLGRPWEELDCLQICLAYLRDVAGFDIPETKALDAKEIEEEFWNKWDLVTVGRAQPFDLIVTPGDSGRLHVGVVLLDGRSVLSSFRALGSIAIPRTRFGARGVIGIYRWRNVA